MKKLFLLSILSLGFLLSACGGGGSTENTAPTVSNVSISGNNSIGETLTGIYTYSDAENDAEGVSTFRWLRDGSAISGATSITYRLNALDANTELAFEVTPIATNGTTTGNAVTSNSITVAAIPTPLNDTGITFCGDAYTGTTDNNDLFCTSQPGVPTQESNGYDTNGDVIPAGQDALYGRDATNNDDTDGHAGFSFTKLDSSGVALANQDQDYATTPWSCVKDNITGLIWEVKTTSGLRSKDHKFTWYNSTTSNNGGGVGISTGTGCESDSNCNTEQYVADVNATNLCGANDWRLTTRHELLSIVNNSHINPAIDENYFSHSQALHYWSSSPIVDNQNDAWSINFNDGSVNNDNKGISNYVRLVRSSN